MALLDTNYKLHLQHSKLSPFESTQHCLTHLTLIPEVATTTVSTNLMFIIKLLSQHVSGIITPIIRRTRVCTAAYGVLHWLWWLWLCGAGMWAMCTVKVTVRRTHLTVIPEVATTTVSTNLMFIIKLLPQHVSGIIMPSIRRTRVCTAAYVTLRRMSNSNFHSAHSSHPSSTQPQPSQPV